MTLRKPSLWLSRLVRSWASRPLARKPKRTWLRLEQFEARVTPTTYTVNVATDNSGSATGSGSGTTGDLRYCLNLAITDGQTDTITFASSLKGDTITLSSSLVTNPADATGLPDSTTAFVVGGSANITIDGSNAPGLSISGNSAVRLFDVTGSAALTLENLTLTGGAATGVDGSSDQVGGGGGGGAGLGGAVYDDGATFTALDCTFTNNNATGGNGGVSGYSVYNGNSIPLNEGDGGKGGGANGGLGGTFPGNVNGRVGGFGGGGGGGRAGENQPDRTEGGGVIGIITAPVGAGGLGGFGGGGGGGGGTVGTKFTRYGAGAQGGFGAGAGGTGAAGTGTAGHNLAYGGGGGGGGAGLGGGVFSNGGTLTLTNDTFFNNTATGGTGGLSANIQASNGDGSNGQGLGGAVFALNGSLKATFVTFSSDSADQGTDVYVLSDGSSTDGSGSMAATADLVDDILGQTNNSVSDFVANSINSGTAPNLSGSANDLVRNNPTSGSLSGTNIMSGVDPLLSPLGNYGGPTETLALLPGSPAIDAGTTVNGVTSDERGVSRPQGSAPDIGAFESQGFTLSATGGDNQSTLINTAFPNAQVVTVTPVHSGDPVAGGQITFTPPGSGASAALSPANPVTIASDGTARVNATANATAGSYDVTADTAGASAPVTFTLINQAATTTTAKNATTTFSTSAQDVQLSAGVTSSAGTVNEGTVKFTVVNSAGKTIGSAVSGSVTSNGTASVSYGLPAYTLAGSYTIDADYSDSAGNFADSSNASQSPTPTLMVNAASTTTTASNATTTFSTSTQDVKLSAGVTSSAGTVNEGTVKFTVVNSAGKTIGSAVSGSVTSNGTASV
ncbi:MAG TPA: choice-of-anchor Q domain-containing protein, partial [Gemmataceae bacterium]|nr:choice-of-anchor Q domain-containing protein [Gemmataceae bacterium]